MSNEERGIDGGKVVSLSLSRSRSLFAAFSAFSFEVANSIRGHAIAWCVIERERGSEAGEVEAREKKERRRDHRVVFFS